MRSFRVLLAAALVSVAAPATAVVGPARASTPPACSAGYVALTFDSGPSPITLGLLDTLSTEKVKATFFLLGMRVAVHPEIAQREYAEGHAIANHTYDHHDLKTLTRGEITTEVTSTQQALTAAGVTPMHLVRPPNGRVDDRVAGVLASLGMSWVNWSINSYDYTGISADQVARGVLANLRPFHRNIVMMHDGNQYAALTIGAVPTIIKGARARGYCFTTLDATGSPIYPASSLSVSSTPGREDHRVPAKVMIRLDRPTSQPITATVSTASGSARQGRDFTRVHKVVSIAPGQTRVVVTIPVRNDHLRERKERFVVTVRGDAHTHGGPHIVRPVILSDDR